MKAFKEIKVLPPYLQPKIISAVAYVHECSPNMDKAIERINTLQKHLSEKEIIWVMSLLTFEKLLDIVEDSQEYEKYRAMKQKRTVN